MPGLPELPITIPPEQRQVDGEHDDDPIYQTHRGKKSGRDVPERPEYPTPDGAGRYAE